MGRRKKPWLHVSAFLVCERTEGATGVPLTGPWTLHGVWHDFQLQSPFAGLAGASADAPLALFVQLMSRLNRLSQPRELEAHLQQSGDSSLVCRYRFATQLFRPGTMTYLTLPLQPPPIPAAGRYEFVLRLDDRKRTILARSEVELTP